jgi:hypothetical protein
MAGSSALIGFDWTVAAVTKRGLVSVTVTSGSG